MKSYRPIPYESRTPNLVFVPVPEERARYILTHRCVTLVPCDQCGSDIGVPCMGAHRYYTASTHYGRRIRARGVNAVAADVIRAEDIQNAEKEL